MKSFNDYILEKEYARLEERGDNLAGINPLLIGRVLGQYLLKCIGGLIEDIFVLKKPILVL